ncbi:unnamed protein product [Effrenium voratum]|uniref:Pseudouridine synthase RsuA/RluA-like domain-containing protein n=1 Tax=Effrenium voratum TaxID=2562239 RepID=A0AA36MJU5_9DINO|nr:unnamed protein product [Effrenium voratum]
MSTFTWIGAFTFSVEQLSKAALAMPLRLRNLRLHRNRIGEAGACALAKLLLESEVPLLELHLSHNRLSPLDARRLIEATAEREEYARGPLWLRLERQQTFSWQFETSESKRWERILEMIEGLSESLQEMRFLRKLQPKWLDGPLLCLVQYQGICKSSCCGQRHRHGPIVQLPYLWQQGRRYWTHTTNTTDTAKPEEVPPPPSQPVRRPYKSRLKKSEPAVLYDSEDLQVVDKGPYWICRWASKSSDVRDWRAHLPLETRSWQEIVESNDPEHLDLYVARRYWDEMAWKWYRDPDNGAGFVHRLDCQTSGCMIRAKTACACDYLDLQMRRRHICKGYLCLAHGHISPAPFRINAPLAMDKWRDEAVVDAREGQWAESYVMPVAYYRWSESMFSLCAVRIVSGKTHQIRKHMEHIGHPLVSDRKYNPLQIYTDRRWCSRLFLHAYEIWLEDAGTRCKVSAPLALDLREALAKLEADTRLSEPKLDMQTGVLQKAVMEELMQMDRSLPEKNPRAEPEGAAQDALQPQQNKDWQLVQQEEPASQTVQPTCQPDQQALYKTAQAALQPERQNPSKPAPLAHMPKNPAVKPPPLALQAELKASKAAAFAFWPKQPTSASEQPVPAFQPERQTASKPAPLAHMPEHPAVKPPPQALQAELKASKAAAFAFWPKQPTSASEQPVPAFQPERQTASKPAPLAHMPEHPAVKPPPQALQAELKASEAAAFASWPEPERQTASKPAPLAHMPEHPAVKPPPLALQTEQIASKAAAFASRPKQPAPAYQPERQTASKPAPLAHMLEHPAVKPPPLALQAELKASEAAGFASRPKQPTSASEQPVPAFQPERQTASKPAVLAHMLEHPAVKPPPLALQTEQTAIQAASRPKQPTSASEQPVPAFQPERQTASKPAMPEHPAVKPPPPALQSKLKTSKAAAFASRPKQPTSASAQPVPAFQPERQAASKPAPLAHIPEHPAVKPPPLALQAEQMTGQAIAGGDVGLGAAAWLGREKD